METTLKERKLVVVPGRRSNCLTYREEEENYRQSTHWDRTWMPVLVLGEEKEGRQ